MYQVKEYIDVNCNGTANLVEAIIHAKQKPIKVILSSSRAIYGEGNHHCTKCNHTTWNTRKTEQLNAGNFEIVCPNCQNPTAEICVEETRLPNPLSIYAETKRNQEEYLKYLPQFHGVPLTILRYFNVYGSQQSLKNPYTGILTVFFNQVQNGQKINIYEDGKPTRDFVHIEDVVQANLLALKLQHIGTEIFNIGSGKKYFIREAAEILAKACNKSTEINETKTFRAGDILACTANINRSEKALGFKPKVSLKKGIEEFVQWAKEQKSCDQYNTTVTELNKYNLIGNLQ
jgi:dTDP-L-rhamnose 4-epimerase